MVVKVVEEELQNSIKFIDHLCYATEVNRFIFGQCIVIIQVACLRRQVGKIIDAGIGSIVVLRWIAQLLLTDNNVERIKVKQLCLFLRCSRRLEFFKLDLYLYLGNARKWASLI